MTRNPNESPDMSPHTTPQDSEIQNFLAPSPKEELLYQPMHGAMTIEGCFTA